MTSGPSGLTGVMWPDQPKINARYERKGVYTLLNTLPIFLLANNACSLCKRETFFNWELISFEREKIWPIYTVNYFHHNVHDRFSLPVVRLHLMSRVCV